MNTDDNTNPDSVARFALLDMGSKPSAKPGPSATEAIAGKTILPRAKAAAANERAMLKDVAGVELGSKGLGFDDALTTGGLVYDEGTKMLGSGVQVALDSRMKWDKLPTANVAAADHYDEVTAEQRSDYRGIALSGLVVDEKGHLTRANGGLRFSDWSWGQVRAMAAKNTPLRNNFNAWLPKSAKTATFRTRHPNLETHTRELFAAVSGKYTVADGHKLLKTISGGLPSETRGRVDYDQDTTRLSADLTLQNPYEIEDDIAVGRLHRLGVRLTTRDDGGERIRIRLYAERIACINCTLIPVEIAGIDHVHKGNVRYIMQAVRNLTSNAGRIMGEFAEHWSAAHITRVFDGAATSEQAQKVFVKLIDGGFVNANGIKKAELVERLVGAWSIEPGNTYQAINRAITRAAHGYSWAPEVDEQLEEQAGQLLYQRVQVVNQLGISI